MADPIDTGILRAATAVNGTVPRVDLLALCDEVDRLRAENTALAAALEDIAEMRRSNVSPQMWVVDGECSAVWPRRCHQRHPDHPDEWCPVCVAEVAWCAWKMGVLG